MPVGVAEEKLTPKQERALLALLDCGEIKRAAEVARVGEGSLWRWLQQPDFQSRYRAARRQLAEAAMSQLQSDCTRAARVLREVAEDKSAPASSRGGGEGNLEQSVRAIELIDLEVRVEHLEGLVKSDAETKDRTTRTALRGA